MTINKGICVGLALAFALATGLASAQVDFTGDVPVAVNTDATSDAAGDDDVRVATDGQGNFVAVWLADERFGSELVEGDPEFDIAYSYYSAATDTWTAPAVLNSDWDGDAENEDAIEVAYGDGTWVAIWAKDNPTDGDEDVFFAASTDPAAGWSAQAEVAPYMTSGTSASGDPGIATDGNGTWLIVWESEDDITIGSDATADDDDLLARWSFDNGATWGGVFAINPDFAGGGADTGNPKAAYVGGDQWVVVAESEDASINGNARNGTVGYIGATPPTVNDGTVFSAPIVLSPTGATPDSDNYEPEYVASDGAGQVLVTFTYEPEDGSFEKDLWVNYSGDFGATWNGPTRLTTSGENASEPNEDSSAAFLADGSVIAVWENEGTLVSGVKVPAYTVSSNGTTWPAEATYESAAPTATPAARTEDAQNPRVAAGSGVVGVFYSEEQDYDFGDGAIGTDNDVMAVFSGELDVDGDGTPDATDAFPNNPEGATDSDADGIGDEWEEKFFGDNDGVVEAGELDVANATSDFDGDGVLDIQEFEQGTDPTFAPPQVPVGGTAALAGLLALAGVVAIRRRR